MSTGSWAGTWRFMAYHRGYYFTYLWGSGRPYDYSPLVGLYGLPKSCAKGGYNSYSIMGTIVSPQKILLSYK